MSDQNRISEYIRSISFKKSFGLGFDPEQVYETIGTLATLYNEALRNAYREIDALRGELSGQEPDAVAMADSRQELPEPPQMSVDEQEQDILELLPTPAATEQEQRPALDAKRLRRLSRGDLLELLIDQSKENEQLRLQLQLANSQAEQLRERLHDRRIKLSKAGTLAEATFLLNGVLESAQQAAQQYLENLPEAGSQQTDEAPQSSQQLLEQAREESRRLLQETEARCREMEAETRRKCALLEQEANLEVEKKWKELSTRLEAFYESHAGLKELIASPEQQTVE